MGYLLFQICMLKKNLHFSDTICIKSCKQEGYIPFKYIYHVLYVLLRKGLYSLPQWHILSSESIEAPWNLNKYSFQSHLPFCLPVRGPLRPLPPSPEAWRLEAISDTGRSQVLIINVENWNKKRMHLIIKILTVNHICPCAINQIEAHLLPFCHQKTLISVWLKIPLMGI